jgi:hypothetical protein
LSTLSDPVSDHLQKYFIEKVIDYAEKSMLIYNLSLQKGGVAQLARAYGSYP